MIGKLKEKFNGISGDTITVTVTIGIFAIPTLLLTPIIHEQVTTDRLERQAAAKEELQYCNLSP